MEYSEALDFLYSRLPMYQRQGKVAYKADLNNTIALLNTLNNPQDKFKSVHIAGTNGKGSSAHAIAAILQLAGYKTGLYTSPHLKEFTERIKINGREISKQWVADFVNKLKPAIERIEPSFFEVTVATAFQYFAEEHVDIAIIETGLGGRLDSTNVLTPEVCLITNIGLDHTDLLGDTIEKIAKEKAGIIKYQVPVVIGDMCSEAAVVMKKVAKQKKSELIETSIDERKQRFEIPYFNRNVPGIRAVIKKLADQGWEISAESVKDGLCQFTTVTGLKGRYQMIGQSPNMVADVSHNADGIKLLLNHVIAKKFKRLHLVYGTVVDKSLDEIFNVFPTNASYYFVQSSVPRSLDANELKLKAASCGIPGEAFENVNMGIKAALEKADSNDLILITGSTFVIAEISGL